MNIIDGKRIAQEIKDELKIEIANMPIKPKLAVILVGDDFGSSKYVKNKEIACDDIGIEHVSYRLPNETTEEKVLSLIDELNNDNIISGILVQLPLPKHIDEGKIINAIDVTKDVDGFHPISVGNLCIGNDCLTSCTPSGIIELLKRSNIEISGKHAVVVGRSNIVGKPMSLLLLKENATVTICHSKTKNLLDITSQGDILIVAIGKPKFIKAEMVKENAVVIDVGINRDENGKMCGDVDLEDCKEKVSYITPVPGGVGPMTVAMLMKNCVKAKKMMERDGITL